MILILHSKLILLEMSFLRGIEKDDMCGRWQHTTALVKASAEKGQS